MKDVCDITIVLDRSGSMKSCSEATISGFNNFLKEQKALPGECRITLAQFDDQYEMVHSGILVNECPELTSETFVPRGLTRLLDAIGETINTNGDRFRSIPESDRPSKVLFVIITDGQENDSKEFSRPKIFDMIKHQTDTYSWNFIFIGANQDSIASAASVGIPLGNAINYNSTPIGTQMMACALSGATRAYRSSNDVSVKDFFDGAESVEQYDDKVDNKIDNNVVNNVVTRAS